MAGSASEDNGVGRSSEGLSGAQRCPSGDSLAEWRSSEQVENGTPSTSPPYWDTDDDDNDCGLKPSELYGKFTWKIENFSQINKRELRSNAFEVGGYKWYILIYPQGCDVCNHLSLFLCVANHDKLLPGWSHFAQFTIAVVNKDPKKSKHSDTLHRFWKKEHDWGWKKFMELSKVLDGFIVSDTLVIKAQVQVIREKAHRPFRCLDCQYRRELVRVYLSNVELICRRFVEERRGKLGKLIEDKVRWSSFRAFWLGVDQYAKRRMSREKSDTILKVVVKHFFIEKEVTSTLVMDSLYSGLKALECQSTAKKERNLKSGEVDDYPSPMIRVEKDSFVLTDDVLSLLERASMEPLPPKDDKGPQNRTKDGNSGEDFNKDSIERDERRLTELGRRTIEIFALAQIFSNRIEVAYQEAVALKRQEELIREEEAAALTENEPRSKRGKSEKKKRSKKKQSKQKRNKMGKDTRREEELIREEEAAALTENEPRSKRVISEKEKRSKKKQSKQKRNKKVKDTRREEKSYDAGERIQQDGSSLKALGKQHNMEKQEKLEDVSDVSCPADDISESFQPDVEDREAGSINWDTDTSEINPPPEVSSCEISSLHVHSAEEKRSAVDDSSSTCSTDSVPSAGTHRHYVMKGSRNRMSPKKSGKNEDISSTVQANENHEAVDAPPSGTSIGAKGEGTALETVLSLKDQIQLLEQTLVEKEVQVESLQRKLGGKEKVETIEKPVNAVKLSSAQSSDTLCPSNGPIASAPIKLLPKQASEPVQSRKNPMNGTSSQTDKPTTVLKVTPKLSVSKSDGHKPGISVKPIQNVTTEKSMTPQVSVMMRPSSVPINVASRPSTSSSSMGQYTSSLARSASASGRLGMDTVSQVSQGIVQQSYRNAIVGKSSSSSSTTFIPRQTPSSTSSTTPTYSQTLSSTFPCSSVMHSSPMPMKQDDVSYRSSFTFGAMNPGILTQPQWMEGTQKDVAGVGDVQLLSDISSLSLYDTSDRRGNSHYTEQMQLRQSQVHEEFPHLDIINDLLDEEQSVGKFSRTGLHSAINGHRYGLYPFNRQLTFPGDIGMADIGPSINSGKYNQTARYHEDQTSIIYSSSNGPYNAPVAPNVSLSDFPTGQIDGITHSQWYVNGTDLSMLNVRSMEGNGYPFQVPYYSNLTCGVNGYSLYRPRSQR